MTWVQGGCIWLIDIVLMHAKESDMLQVFNDIVAELAAIEQALLANIPLGAPLSMAIGNWGAPGVTQQGLVRWVSEISSQITAATIDESGGDLAELALALSALQFLRTSTMPQMVGANGPIALPAFTITLQSVERALAPFVNNGHKVALENSKALRKAANQIRAIESRLREISPKTSSLELMIGRIEQAYDAADQLPADLESLSEARQRINAISVDAEKDRGQILGVKDEIVALQDSLKAIAIDAEAILKQCESVYSSATSVGLAAAFSERSKVLDRSMWFWVGGLFSALLVGGIVGGNQLRSLSQLISAPGATGALITMNGILSILAVGAPVWFAWLSTKQIGQRFRLSEDYAFKASVSRAYEGFRREAVRIDPKLEAQLLQSALSRLDEQPLRLVESTSYGSPWHELLDSNLMKEALRTVPGIVQSMTTLAKQKVADAKGVKELPAANSPIKPATSDEDQEA